MLAALQDAPSPASPAPRDGAEEPPRASAAQLALIRQRLATLARGEGEHAPAAVPLGVPALDAALPGGGLAPAGLHRLTGASSEWDAAAVAGFALALGLRLAAADAKLGDRRKRPLVWIGPAAPYAPGLVSLGLDPARLLTVRAAGEIDQLWALEEVLRSGEAVAALCFLRGLDRVSGRRLQLAAARGNGAALVVESRPRGEPVPAMTGWRIAAAPAAPAAPPLDPARPAWRAELLQARGGRPQEAILEWDHATTAFALAA